jgi:hypothetical protein
MLRHDLSCYYSSRAEHENDLRVIYTRTLSEMAASQELANDLRISLSRDTSGEFCQVMRGISAIVNGQVSYIRRRPVMLRADNQGIFWAFPPANDIQALLEQLFGYLSKCWTPHPLLSAVVALVQINCIHPFMDGNGRTSRAIFNALLQQAGVLGEKQYIPAKSIYMLSQHGFEIRLRELVLDGNWVPILHYFAALTHLFSSAGRSGEQGARMSMGSPSLVEDTLNGVDAVYCTDRVEQRDS